MRKETLVPQAELETLAVSLTEVFIQRRDLYSRQLDDGRYLCIRKPLTNGHLLAHLKGDITLGTYVLDQESQARFIAFDADDDEQMEGLVSMSAGLATAGSAFLSREKPPWWSPVAVLLAGPPRPRCTADRTGADDVSRFDGRRAVSQTRPSEKRPWIADPPPVWRSPPHGTALRLHHAGRAADRSLHSRTDPHLVCATDGLRNRSGDVPNAGAASARNASTLRPMNLGQRRCRRGSRTA